MHHCRLRNERVPWILDIVDQVHLLAAGNCIWSFSWQGRAQCPLCGVYWQRHLEILRQVQTECGQNAGNIECLCCSGGRGGVWKSHWWCSFLFRSENSSVQSLSWRLTCPGNVIVFSIENHVAELFLCFGCYCSASGMLPLMHIVFT